MYLKEAFRYQNYLDKLMEYASLFLMNSDNVTKVKQIHFKAKAKQGAEDEELDATPKSEIDAEISDVIDFTIFLVEEKHRLCEAINKAKAGCGFDIDSALLTNKFRQRAAEIMNKLAQLRSGEYTKTGTAYTFNVNGDQTAYNYEIKEVRTIDYDRKKAKKLQLALSAESDDVSAKCDIAMTSTPVEFDPAFNVNDSFADAIARFVESKE